MAKNYNRSDYALNKYSASIVYSDADGVYELTKEAFLASDPSLTEADYEYWKRISDADYLATARRDTYESRHTVSLDELADGVLAGEESTEDEVLEKLEPTDNPYTYENAMRILDACLTETQKRRFLKYRKCGMTVRDIAIEEGVHPSSVDETIHAAEKKIKNFFETA